MTGGSTLIVSLPKGWAKANGLRNEDYVSMEILPDGSLRVAPARESASPRESTMRVTSRMSVGSVVREFISRYLAGYDIIRVSFDADTHPHRSMLKSILGKKTIGVEAVEEAANEVVFQCLAKASEIPVKAAIKRMANTCVSMLSDAIRCVDSLDEKLSQDVVERDDVVDKFYLFIVRQLKSVAAGLMLPDDVGLDDLRSCLGFRTAAKAIERVGDHSQRIASAAMRFGRAVDRDIRNILIDFGGEVLNLLVKAVSTLLKPDVKLAHEVVESADSVKQLEGKALETLFSKHGLDLTAGLAIWTVAGSLRRVAEYSADIAEVALNLSVESPKSRFVPPEA